MEKLKRSIHYISFPLFFVGFIFPIYASNLGANIMEIGYLFSIFSIVGIVIRPMVGSIIDKRGRKTGVIVGIIFYSLMNIIFTLAVGIKYLFIARVLQSIAGSFLWISVDTIISDISDNKNIGKNFGILDGTIAKGSMIGSAIGFMLLYNNNSANPFMLIYLMYFLTSMASLFYCIKEVPETINYKISDNKEESINIKDIRMFLVIMGFISFITSLTAPIYLIYLQDKITNDLGLISQLFIPAGILSMFLPRKFGAMSDKYGREKIIVIGMFINAMLQVLIPLTNSFFSFMILYTLISIVLMFYGPALSSLIIDYVGKNKRGKSFGLYSFATGIGATMGPLAGAYIYGNIGKDMVFYIKGILLVAMAIIVCYLYIMILRKNTSKQTPKFYE